MKKLTKKYLLSSFAFSMAFCGLLGVNALQTKADEYDPFEDFAIVEDAEIRTENPVGIRFVTEVSEEQLALASEFGTLVIPKALLQDGDIANLTVSTEDAAKIVAEKWLDEEQTAYAGVIVGGNEEDGYTSLPASFYDDVLVARSYAVVDGDVVYSTNYAESSIAQAAAIALKSEQTELLQSIVNHVLADDFAFAKSELTLTTDSAPTAVALETKGLSAVITNSNPAVASYANGKVTALSIGETTITAKIGEQTATLKVTVDVAPLEGTKLATWSDEFVAANVAQVKDGGGNGACELSYSEDKKVLGAGTLKVKSTSGYARFRVFPLKGLSLNTQYEKVVFYVYVDGNGQYCNGNANPLSNGAWTKIEVNTSSTTTDYLQISFHTYDYGHSNNGGVFYVSEVYGVSTGFTKIIDFTSANAGSVLNQTVGEATPTYSTAQSNGDDGSMLVTVNKNYARLFFINSSLIQYEVAQKLHSYQKLTFGVYLDASEGEKPGVTQLVAMNGSSKNLAKNAWTWITVDAPEDLSAVLLDLRDSQYWQSKGMKFYISDIYAYNPTKTMGDKLVDFTAENYSSFVTIGGGTGNALSFEYGLLKSTNANVDGNCNLTFTFKGGIDVSAYSKIQLYIYKANGNQNGEGRNVYFDGVVIKDIGIGIHLIEIDVSTLTTLDGHVLKIMQPDWHTMKGEIHYISDIYGVK